MSLGLLYCCWKCACASQGADFQKSVFPNHTGRWNCWSLKHTMNFAHFQQCWLVLLVLVCKLVSQDIQEREVEIGASRGILCSFPLRVTLTKKSHEELIG